MSPSTHPLALMAHLGAPPATAAAAADAPPAGDAAPGAFAREMQQLQSPTSAEQAADSPQRPTKAAAATRSHIARQSTPQRAAANEPKDALKDALKDAPADNTKALTSDGLLAAKPALRAPLPRDSAKAGAASLTATEAGAADADAPGLPGDTPGVRRHSAADAEPMLAELPAAPALASSAAAWPQAAVHSLEAQATPAAELEALRSTTAAPALSVAAEAAAPRSTGSAKPGQAGPLHIESEGASRTDKSQPTRGLERAVPSSQGASGTVDEVAVPAHAVQLGSVAPAATGSPASSLALAAPTFAAELSRPQPGPMAAAPSPAPVELSLPTPVNAPEFVPRLSGEIAILARDGVQEARVNLHPVELGPISVQIAVDGSNAQVHLAADNALTRELLDRALPNLAAALRDSGLTLTGGGVFQQHRNHPREPSAAESAAAGSGTRQGSQSVGGDLPASTSRRWNHNGALDVFA